jgi:hypothetical protein
MALHRWAQDRANSADLRATEVHHFVDQARMSVGFRARVKMLADVAYHHACRDILGCCLSIGDAQSDLASTLESQPDNVDVGDPGKGFSVVPIKEWVPFERLAALPLDDVLTLRAETPFVELRDALRRVRWREPLAVEALESTLRKCLTLLRDYVKAPEGFARRAVLKTHDPLPIASLFVFARRYNAGRDPVESAWCVNQKAMASRSCGGRECRRELLAHCPGSLAPG